MSSAAGHRIQKLALFYQQVQSAVRSAVQPATRLAIQSLILSSTLLLQLGLCANAASDSDRDNIRKAMLLYRENNPEAALVVLNKELQRLNKPSLKTRAMRIKFYVAKIKADSDPRTGIKELQDVLKEQRKSLGASHPDTINSLRTLAEVHKVDGNEQESKIYFEKALKAEKELFGNDHPRITRTELLILRTGGDNKTGKSTVDMIVKSPEVLEKFNIRQGTAMFRAYDFKKARDHLSQAIQRIEEKYGPEDKQLDDLIWMRGHSELVLNDFSQAKKDLLRSQVLCTKHKNPVIEAKVFYSLALLNEYLEKKPNSKKNYEQYLAVAKKAEASRNFADPLIEKYLREVTSAAKELAFFEFRSGKAEEGKETLLQCRAYLLSLKNRTQDQLRFQLVRTYFQQARLSLLSGKDPKNYYWSLIKEARSRLKPTDKFYPEVVEGDYVEALCLCADGKKAEALKLLNRAYEVAVKLENLELQAYILLQKEAILKKLGNTEEAELAGKLGRENALKVAKRFMEAELAPVN